MAEIQGFSESQQEAVRAELNGLLESAAFRTSRRCREFLTYIVEHTINGPSGTLKERSIGADLFQLPHDYDTGQHTVVRVTASEVRKKLAQHYLAQNGSYHPVRIDLPPGSYTAEFRWDQLPEETKVRPRRTWLTRRTLAGASALFALATTLFLFWWLAIKPPSVGAKSTALASPIARVPSGGGDLRMIMGSTSPYIDRSGRTWQPDRFFSGGSVLIHPSERIFRTLDPDIYRHTRTGDFHYDVPLEPGSYELHLHFAETGLADFISA